MFPDPFSGIAGGIVAAFAAVLRALARSFLSGLAAPMARYVLHTPDLGAEPTLRRVWLLALAVLWSCAGLIVALAATASIAGGTQRAATAAREAFGGRLLGGLLTASVALPLVALEVQLANRMVDPFLAGATDTTNSPLWQALHAALSGDLGASLALLVTTLVAVALLVALVVVGLARWATLWLLVGLAPLVMGFGVLPGGVGLARLWWRLQLAAVFLPMANAVLLATYAAMFASQRTGLVGALSGVAVLALMAKLPGWVAGAAVGVEGHDLTRRLHHGGRAARGVAVALALAPNAAAVRTAGGATSYRSEFEEPEGGGGDDR